ncbi:MAG TPA: hypothetical protein VFO52_04605 [Longimicrobiales bacterium]|nr:hypothetical protein [Longimicrobiales bacterium]
MKRKSIVIALSMLALSCSDTTTAPELMGRSYVLGAVNDQPLPVSAPCYSFQVMGAFLSLGPLHRATYELHWWDQQTNSVLVFQGSGFATLEDGWLRVRVSGQWSHTFQPTTFDLRFQIRDNGIVLARTGVGAECDGNSTELYYNQSVLRGE